MRRRLVAVVVVAMGLLVGCGADDVGVSCDGPNRVYRAERGVAVSPNDPQCPTAR